MPTSPVSITPELLGPLALTVGALIAVYVLWRLVIDYIAELKASRDGWKKAFDDYGPKFAEQTDALETLERGQIALAASFDRIERRLEAQR